MNADLETDAGHQYSAVYSTGTWESSRESHGQRRAAGPTFRLRYFILELHRRNHARTSGTGDHAHQDFLTLWNEADPDIPILEQTDAEYAKLQ